jgi:hypothetical protein
MKLIKTLLVALVLLVNVVIIQPALADPISEKSPDYPRITQALDELLQVRANPEQTEYSAAELEQKIATLQLQKYVLETSEDWGVCRNETGKTLGVYLHQPKQANQDTLYYLADGESTDDNYDCSGIYLPNDAKVAGLDLAVGAPVALSIVDGTQLTATTNPTTGKLELNVPSALTQIVNVGEASWSIPNLAQADIDAQTPNAPAD